MLWQHKLGLLLLLRPGQFGHLQLGQHWWSHSLARCPSSVLAALIPDYPDEEGLSARAVCLHRQEEEVVHDGDGVGDERQQQVLPLSRHHLVVVLVQVVQQQREPFASHSAISWLPGRGQG